jgi:hypothetical protein
MALPDENVKLTELLDDVRRRWDALDATVPAAPRRVYRAATREVVGLPAEQDGRQSHGV